MHNENKVPLIRLAKRDMMEPVEGLVHPRCLHRPCAPARRPRHDASPCPTAPRRSTAYGTIITGALGKKTAIRQTVKLAVPLLGCALAIAPCFKMRFWNIGAEGQITAGAIAASYFALYWVGKTSHPLSCSSSWVWRALSPAASGR